MYDKLNKHFKPLSAEEDANFENHFVLTKYTKRILSDESDVVFGTKGSGKTAISLNLIELNKDKYLNTIPFDLDSLNFKKHLANLKELTENLSEDINVISRAAWKNCLLNEALHAFCESDCNSVLSKNIKDAYKEEGCSFSKTDRGDQKVSSVLDSILNKISKFPLTDNSFSSSMTAENAGVIGNFPLNRSIAKILPQVVNKIITSGRKILVSVDGLDSISDHTFESRNVIFTGLIDAIYHLRLDAKLSEAFVFKAFLPQELTVDAKIKIWDSDKHLHNTHYIKWNSSSLQNFILKRFQAATNKTQRPFSDAWNDFFPSRITNPVYNMREKTFDYILRHTLYRPRQLQNHLYIIMRRWIEQVNKSGKIPDTFIPKVISENNIRLAEQVAEQQLSRIYPKLPKFLKSWKGSPTSVKVKDFKSRIANHFDDELESVDRIFNDLYTFGIFGLSVDSNPISSNMKSKKFHFSFANDRPIAIDNLAKDNDLLGFSPMFRKYCGLLKENDYYIIPVSYDTHS